MIGTVLTAAIISALPTHNVHVSLGEAEWTGDALEISLDVRTDDLERAIRGAITKPAVQALLTKEVQLHHDTAKTPIPTALIGYERHGATTTLFFEFAVRGAPANYALSMSLFFELERSQKHTIVLTHGKTQRTLHFDAAHRRRALWPTEKR